MAGQLSHNGRSSFNYRAGHDVALWSHHAGKARQLAAAEKGRFCETPKQVAEHAEAIFVCVGDTAMVKVVILGPNGVAESAKAGTVVADASTIGPSDSRRIGAALAAKGVEYLDAPCTGSRAGAEGGTLTFYDRRQKKKSSKLLAPTSR